MGYENACSCAVCKRKCRTARGLSSHWKQAHDPDRRKRRPLTPQTVITCEFCKRTEVRIRSTIRWCRTCVPTNNQRAWGLATTFNMSWPTYLGLIAQCNGSCQLCHQPCNVHACLSTDHDHVTGLFRGLLCNVCNTLLGIWEKHPDRFQSFILNVRAYLKIEK